ncbi:MAG: hypothetical protein L0220_13565 [Acidobacteria bacterium]|nr:hypothetical protein [Acidobacteriota bacterium]
MNFDLEEELKRALRREDASPNFSDRVMERIARSTAATKRENSREGKGWRQRLAELLKPVRMKWAVAGATACLLTFTVLGVHRYREHQREIAEIAEGERAREQVILAMKIASAKLNIAQKKVVDSR